MKREEQGALMFFRASPVAVGLLLGCFCLWLIASRQKENSTVPLQEDSATSLGGLRTDGLRRLESGDHPGPVGQAKEGAVVPLDRIESLISAQKEMIRATRDLHGNAAKLALSKVELFRDRDVDDLLSEFPAQDRIELEARLRAAVPIPAVPDERVIILPARR